MIRPMMDQRTLRPGDAEWPADDAPWAATQVTERAYRQYVYHCPCCKQIVDVRTGQQWFRAICPSCARDISTMTPRCECYLAAERDGGSNGVDGATRAYAWMVGCKRPIAEVRPGGLLLFLGSKELSSEDIGAVQDAVRKYTQQGDV